MKKYLWTQISIPVIATIAIVIIALIFIINAFFEQNNKNQLHEQAVMSLSGLESNIANLEKEALKIATIHATSSTTDSAYSIFNKTGNFEESANIFNQKFGLINSELQQNTGEQIGIHFHIPPARSLYRSWTDKRGDDLSSFRFTVKDVINSNKSVSGIEVGRGGLVIRGITPVKNNEGKNIGSVECFFSVESLIKNMKSSEIDDYAILVDKKTADFEDASYKVRNNFSKSDLGNYILYTATSDNIQTNILDGKIIENALKTNENFSIGNYMFAVAELKDYANQPIGIILFQHNIEEQNSVLRKLSSTTIILGIAVLIFLSLIIAFLSRKIISEPVKIIVKNLENIGNGDLRGNIEITRKDEIGKLQKNASIMSDKLKELIGSIQRSTEQISSASNQLSSSSQQVSQASNEQAASAEEISSTMEEMQANIQQNAENSIETERIAVKAANDIETGSKSVSQTVKSMKIIAQKISIISEIAYQTNILALNAAVEAARVGDEGRGFAVVAAEVRTLAERSRKAAEEINIISSESVAIAENSENILNSIVPDIKKTSILVKEITLSSKEQVSSVNQVSQAVDQLNKATQMTSAVSEEVASSSEELDSQAEQLKNTINFFKTGKFVESAQAYKSKKIHKTQKNTNHFTKFQAPVKSKSVENDDGFQIDLAENSNDIGFEKY